MNTFRDVIAAFGGGASLARQIGEEPVTVRAWGQRNSIPSTKWARVVRAAREKGVKHINTALLARLAEHKEDAA